MWARGSLTSSLIRNERVCFQLNISPTADETGTGLYIPDSWQLGKLYCGSCPVTSPLPGGLLPAPKPWGLPASLDENLIVAKGAHHISPLLLPRPSILPCSLSIDLISTDVNLDHGNFTRHSEDKHLSRGTVHAAAQRRDNSVASLEKGMYVLCG